MSWLHNGIEFTSEDIKNYVGFVYLITNQTNGKQYIGKKLFWAIKRKQVKNVRKRYKAESDWKEYWSSSEELKADVQLLGKKNFTREILHLCTHKGTANYLEAREQIDRRVLESDHWYNGWIAVKVQKKHIKM